MDKEPDDHRIRYSKNSPQFFLELDNDHLLISNLEGLVKLNKNTGSYYRYKFTEGTDWCFYSFVKYNDNEIYIGTWGNGLVKVNLKDTTLIKFEHNTSFSNDGASNIILNISKKDNDEIYVATIDSGFGVFNTVTKKLPFIRQIKQIIMQLSLKTMLGTFFIMILIVPGFLVMMV